jgi:hypothetical protein
MLEDNTLTGQWVIAQLENGREILFQGGNVHVSVLPLHR